MFWAGPNSSPLNECAIMIESRKPREYRPPRRRISAPAGTALLRSDPADKEATWFLDDCVAHETAAALRIVIVIANTFAGLMPAGPRTFPQDHAPKNALCIGTLALSSWPWHHHFDFILYQPLWEGTLRWRPPAISCLRLKLRKT